MKIGFVIQRYGTEILGGAEYLCRLVAERLADRHEVSVLTTCARDYISWKNEYPEGVDRVRGVTVHRFANAETRDIADFNRYSDWIFNYAHTRDDEMEWLRRQGPWCPALLDFLERRSSAYDVLIFFTYLYAPTVLGLRVSPDRSILVPTAHDEPAIRLGIYRDVFSLPAGIAFNTDVERRFVASQFDIGAIAQETTGCGVDLLPERIDPREGGQVRRTGEHGLGAAAGTPAESATGPAWRDTEVTRVGRYRVGARGTQFRRRHRLDGPMLLYGGRIDPGKGCEELFEYFRTYVAGGGDGTLVLMGVKLMPIPEEPWVRFAGMLPEQERLQALEAATVVAVPSPYESLSLLALEAFGVGTPILANGRSEVLVDHCRSSNAGLWYETRDEFVEGLRLLVADSRLRAAMGAMGRDYIRRNYRWDVVLAKYETLFSKLRGRPAA